MAGERAAAMGVAERAEAAAKAEVRVAVMVGAERAAAARAAAEGVPGMLRLCLRRRQ